MGCMYKLTFPSGKSYIGISLRDAITRFERHVKRSKDKSTCAVHNAIRKYGSGSVLVETLLVSDSTEYLRLMERKAIAAFKTMSPLGYNMTGGSEESHFWSKDVLQKAKASQVARWSRIDKETKAEMLKPQIEAMRSAMADPVSEMIRASKISRTMRSGRSKIARGESRPNSKMTPIKVDLARALISHGIKDDVVASQFGVSRELIRDIRNGKRWAHV